MRGTVNKSEIHFQLSFYFFLFQIIFLFCQYKTKQALEYIILQIMDCYGSLYKKTQLNHPKLQYIKQEFDICVR